MDTIGTRIKEVRKVSAVTQKEFSERICVTQSYVSRLESGVEQPTDMLLKLISLEFNISLEWLRNNEGTMIVDNRRFEYWDRKSAKGFREGVIVRTNSLLMQLDKYSNPVLDNNINALLLNLEMLLELFSNNEHFSSIIIESITRIVLSFYEAMKRLEALNRYSDTYKEEVFRIMQHTEGDIWNVLNEIHILYDKKS